MSSGWCSCGCGQQASEETRQIVASVEAELELSEVAPDVRAPDRLVGSSDSGLQVAEHGVHPFQSWDLFRLLGFACRDDRRVRCAGSRERTKATETIRDDMRSRN